jgi:hypothetical protein
MLSPCPARSRGSNDWPCPRPIDGPTQQQAIPGTPLTQRSQDARRPAGYWTPPGSPRSSTGVPGTGQGARALACAGRDRRIKDRLTDQRRVFNRVQAGRRALVEQSIAHLGDAWALRRRRGLYRLRDVYRAAAALICLGRWIHRVTA